jgi:hypothetical protein
VIDYNNEIQFLKKVETNDFQNERTKLDDEKIALMKSTYKNIPEDYLQYLKQVGWESFRECQFMVYESLMTLSDIGMELENDEYNHLLFFGDNFSGDLSGFDLTKNGNVIEYWHDSDEIYETNKTFKEYIRDKMLMDEQGKDLRSK